MVSDAQQRVAAFVATHDMDAPPAYRLLNVASELGELAKEVNESTGYGSDPTRSVSRPTNSVTRSLHCSPLPTRPTPTLRRHWRRH
jgi:hypothetical protein